MEANIVNSYEHCKVVKDGLDGNRLIDEQTFDSLAVLTERLERVKKLGPVFSDVAFSKAVQKLTKQDLPLVAC